MPTNARWTRRRPSAQRSHLRSVFPTSPFRSSPAMPTPQIPSAAGMNLTAGALSGGTGPSYDVSVDPAVMAAQTLAEKMRAQAQAVALAKRRQAAIEFGAVEGIEGIDEETRKAALDNPFSVLKNLERDYTRGKGDLEEGLNKSNLFYSGYRGQELARAGEDYQRTKHDASSNFRALLADINNQLSGALLGADEMQINALLGSTGGLYDPGLPEVAPATASAARTRPAARPSAVAGFGGGLGGALVSRRANPRTRSRPAGFGGGLGYALTRRGSY